MEDEDCTEIFAAVIRWHPPANVARTKRRGGYHPPGCFPIGETTSVQSADNAVSNIIRRNLMVQFRNMAYRQHRNPNWAKSVLPRNLQRWRPADSRPYELNRRYPSANYLLGAILAGAQRNDIVRMVPVTGLDGRFALWANRIDATSFVSWWLPHAKHGAFRWVRVRNRHQGNPNSNRYCSLRLPSHRPS